jgi:hypothetical protein
MSTLKQIASFADLVKELEAGGAPHKADAERQTIEMRTGADALGNMVYLRWEKVLPFIQIIQPMISNVPEDRIPHVETAVVRVNALSTVAGLSFDHKGRSILFRITAPVLVDGIRSDLLQSYIHGAVVSAGQLLAAMQQIVKDAPGDTVMQLLNGPTN